MPREAIISFEQVAAAAESMQASGMRPTTRLVRERLGNKGSHGTIHKHLQRWQAEHGKRIVATLTLPEAVQRTILQHMETEITNSKAELTTELVEIQQAAADLATENERQSAELDSFAAVMESLQADVANFKGRCSQLETDLEAARDEAARERAAAESARTDLAKAILRLEAMPRLEADLQDARAALKEKDVQREDAARTLAVKEAEFAALQGRIGTERQALQDQLNAERQHGKDVIARLEADKKRLESQLDETLKDARTAAASAATLRAQLDAVTKDNGRLTAELADMRRDSRSGKQGADPAGKNSNVEKS